MTTCTRMAIDGRVVGQKFELKIFYSLRYIGMVDTCWFSPFQFDAMVVSWREWEWGSAREVAEEHPKVQARLREVGLLNFFYNELSSLEKDMLDLLA